MKKLILIDGHALVHRSYHALPPLVSPEGVLVNGVYGFLLVFLKMLRELQPDYMVATFDMAAPTFRSQEYKEYKAGRRKMPDNFYEQIQIVHQLLQAFSVPIFEKEGYEADDIIGTIVEKVKGEKIKVIIVTGDFDTLQLVNDQVNVYTMRQGLRDQIIYTPDKVRERFQIDPAQLRDWKALRGDPSDNVPGVPSIGEKTAQKLVSKYDNLENLYADIKEGKKIDVSPRILALLKEFEDQAYFSRHLVSIQKDVPLTFDLKEAEFNSPSQEQLIPLLEELGFTSLIPKIFVSSSRENNHIKPVAIKIVQSSQEEQELKEKIRNTKTIGLLLDYQGERWGERKVKGLGLSISPELLFYIPCQFFSDYFNDADLWKGKKLITSDAKILMEEVDFFSQFLMEDIKILAWLLDPDRRNYTVPSLGKFFLKKEMDDSLESSLMVLIPLFKDLENKLSALGIDKVWHDIEQPLIPILASMEKGGILVDKSWLEELGKRNKEEIQDLEKKIYQLGKGEFNINSSQQLMDVLFQQLKISSQGLRKTPKGKISLKIEELEKIKEQHPIIPLVIRYREAEKLRNSFLEKLPHFINSQTGKIHTIWKQTGTATGRLSSEKPNLQNIPQKTEWGNMIRKSFQAPDDCYLLSFDYSQIELRLAAHLSGDSAMIEVFEMGKDIHVITASYVNNIPEEKVTSLMREQAKALNFGILYGMGDRSFASTAQIPLAKAKTFRQIYFDKFVGLKRYLDYSQVRAKQLGYAETVFGRKRLLPLIGAGGRLGQEQMRIALNMPIQGLAADIIKMTMKQMQDFIQKNHYQNQARIILQIHDELILEVQSAIIEEIAQEGRKIMLKVAELRVPLEVHVSRGINWGEMDIFKFKK